MNRDYYVRFVKVDLDNSLYKAGHLTKSDYKSITLEFEVARPDSMVVCFETIGDVPSYNRKGLRWLSSDGSDSSSEGVKCGYEVNLEELVESFLERSFIPFIKRVVYNGPATIVFWQDGTKTVAKCSSKDSFSKLAGLNVCFLKKMMGEEEYKKLVIDRVEE